jgi:hypothetical protein
MNFNAANPFVLTFEVLGRAQQRGSKSPFVLKGKGGKIKTRANGSPIIVVPDDNERSAQWMENVRTVAWISLRDAYGCGLIDFPVELSVQFYFSRPKSHYGSGKNADVLKASAPTYHAQSPDLAKLVRSLEDGMTGAVWQDDRQVVAYRSISREWVGREEPEMTRVCVRSVH